MRNHLYHFIVLGFGLIAMNEVSALCCNNGFYLNGNIGYARTDWEKSGLFPSIVVPNFSLKFDNFRNSRNGFVYGTNAGYLFNRFVGVEMGGYVLPEVKAHYTINTVPAITIKGWDNLTHWLLYSAGKFILPMNQFDLFFKAGAAYRNVKFRGQDQHNNNLDINDLSFIGGGGIQYHLSSVWNVEAQWLHVSGYTNTFPNVAMPAADLFVASLGINLNNLV